MDFTTLAKVAYSDQLILTTEQLAEFYGCDISNIKKNFNANKDRFIEGKHYFKLEGEALKNFKNMVTKSYSVNGNMVPESYPVVGKNANVLYLWTKQGAARHAKMLSTDKAWEVFELLEDNYFNAKEKFESAPKVENAVAVQNDFEMKLLVAPALKDIEISVELVEKLFGVKPGIALVTCIHVAEKNHGLDLSAFNNLLPPADHEIGYLTATQLGKKIAQEKNLANFSAQKVNQVLLEQGLQEKDENGGYRLTEKGKKYGEAIPFNNNKSGHSGYQIKWSAAVSNFF